MGDFCVARQPIFDAKLRVVAYELLFRERVEAREARVSCSEAATAGVLLHAFGEIGLDALVGAADGFVNVPADLLVQDPPLPRPASRIVVELLEDAVATPELLAAMVRAKRRGYRVALDDFVVGPDTEALIRVADVVKLDVLALGDDLEAHVQRLRPFGVPLLAEKIETHEELERCRDLGFAWFQGYFLARPRGLTSRTMSARGGAVLSLLAILQDPAVDPEELAGAVARDVVVSYKLLRYVNSAFFSLRRTVSSVRDAVTVLGTTAVRRWATLLALASVDDLPDELVATALIRARTCELLAPGAADADAWYTAGLFSVVDAMLDLPLREVVDRLPLDDEIRFALLERRGRVGAVLDAMELWERGDLDALGPDLRDDLGSAYLEALEHAERVSALSAAG